jgi:hypothetical protein
MNNTETIGSWNVRKARLKQKFPVLTDSDLVLESETRDLMFENLKTKLGISSRELHEIIIAL